MCLFYHVLIKNGCNVKSFSFFLRTLCPSFPLKPTSVFRVSMPGPSKCLQSHAIFAISVDVFFLTWGKNVHFLSQGTESGNSCPTTFLPQVKKKAQHKNIDLKREICINSGGVGVKCLEKKRKLYPP